MRDMLDKQHRSIAIRALLDSPLRQRSFWFWLVSPLLFFVAAIWSAVAKLRRYRGYAPFPAGQRPLVLCCGNISLGGTGKSPIVRAIARDFLKAGVPVAIVTRGVGAAAEDLVMVGQVCGIPLNRSIEAGAAHAVPADLLGDEAREHLELLRDIASPAFLVFQGRDRAGAIKAFAEILTARSLSPGRGVCLLDDGLQTFLAPRQMNLCVWDPHLLRSAPAWPPPVGPYRETGLRRFGELLLQFEFRLWSRAPAWSELGDLKAAVRDALAHWQSDVDIERDLFVFEEPWAREARVTTESWCFEGPSSSPEATLQRLSSAFASVLILHGIARGEGFSRSVRRHLASDGTVKIHEVALADHGALTTEALSALRTAETLVCTAKDFFRWCDVPRFREAARGKRIVVCGLEVGITRMDGQPCRLSTLIHYQEMMREVSDAP
jgi:tetraacyldisaccharide-1-P 4'-kinase